MDRQPTYRVCSRRTFWKKEGTQKEARSELFDALVYQGSIFEPTAAAAGVFLGALATVLRLKTSSFTYDAIVAEVVARVLNGATITSDTRRGDLRPKAPPILDASRDSPMWTEEFRVSHPVTAMRAVGLEFEHDAWVRLLEEARRRPWLRSDHPAYADRLARSDLEKARAVPCSRMRQCTQPERGSQRLPFTFAGLRGRRRAGANDRCVARRLQREWRCRSR